MKTAKSQGQSIARPPARARRILRVGLRWGCILLAMSLLVVLVLGYFLNRVGLPKPAKQWLIGELRQHGWNVQFSRLRLRWSRGLVADDLQLQRTNRNEGPQIFVEEAQCAFNHAALAHFKFVPTSLNLKDGRITWPVSRTGKTRRYLDIRGLTGALQLNPDDTWKLKGLQAEYRGLHFQISGTLTNASALRDWRFARKPSAGPGKMEDWLDRIEAIARQVSVAGTPELELVVHGDARTFQDFHAGISLRAAGFASPWGRGTNLILSANLTTAPDSNNTAHAFLRLSAEQADTPWAQAGRVEVESDFVPSWSGVMPTNADLEIRLHTARTSVGQAEAIRLQLHSRPAATNVAVRQTDFTLTAAAPVSKWGRADQLRFTGQLAHSPTNWLPASETTLLVVNQLETRWGRADAVQLHSRGALGSTNALIRTNLTWPERLAEIPFAADGTITNLSTSEVNSERATFAVQWQAPRLHLETTAELDGHLDARVDLDTATRQLQFHVASRLAAQRIVSWLGTNAPAWLKDFSFSTPPQFQADGSLVLPAWTNRPPDWQGAVLPTLAAEARFDLGESRFRELEVQQLRSAWACTNGVIQLRRLQVTRPEGGLEALGHYDLATGEFFVQTESQLDPKILQPLFHHPKAQRGFDIVQFTEPPRIRAQMSGNRKDWTGWHGSGEIAVTNFAVRGQSARDCVARCVYTNQFLSVLSPVIEREGEIATADGIGIDLRRSLLYLTNIAGNLNPYALLRAINTKTAQTIERYQFAVMPQISGGGVIGLKARDHAENVHFHVAGGPFHWHVFNLTNLSGDVSVVGETVQLTNLVGGFYEGRLAGNAWFDWSGTNGTDLGFFITLQNASLALLMKDVSSQTNHLEGRLSGYLDVTHANSDDPKSWEGYGHLELVNGLIWDIPVFGLVSRMLNQFVPGLGYSRAKEAVADYSITNSVVFTKDLDIRATGMRMHYKGTVGFDETLDARVEAELLRDLPGFGFLFSTVLMPVTKLFVLKVTGTWNDPVTEPLYIIPNLVSKIILVPFRPLSTFKEMLVPETKPEKPNPADNPPRPKPE